MVEVVRTAFSISCILWGGHWYIGILLSFVDIPRIVVAVSGQYFEIAEPLEPDLQRCFGYAEKAHEMGDRQTFSCGIGTVAYTHTM